MHADHAPTVEILLLQNNGEQAGAELKQKKRIFWVQNWEKNLEQAGTELRQAQHS